MKSKIPIKYIKPSKILFSIGFVIDNVILKD